MNEMTPQQKELLEASKQIEQFLTYVSKTKPNAIVGFVSSLGYEDGKKWVSSFIRLQQAIKGATT